MPEPIPIFSAARRLGEKSSWTLTHLQMQKMLYIAHMYYLGINNQPLVDGYFEAWDYGPVHPDLYHYMKRYGADPIPQEALAFASPVDKTHPGVPYLDGAVTTLPRNRLIAITHWEQGAWAKNYEPRVMGIPITDAEIVKEYNNRMETVSQ